MDIIPDCFAFTYDFYDFIFQATADDCRNLNAQLIIRPQTNTVNQRAHNDRCGDVHGFACFDCYEVGGTLSIGLFLFAHFEVGVDIVAVGKGLRFRVAACDGLIAQVGGSGCVDVVHAVACILLAVAEAEDEGFGGAGMEAGCCVNDDIMLAGCSLQDIALIQTFKENWLDA